METILKAMERVPDDTPLSAETRLADIGFVKADFNNFTTLSYYLLKSSCPNRRRSYCKNAFNVEPHFDSGTQESLVQNGTVRDLEERVLSAVKGSKAGSIGDR